MTSFLELNPKAKDRKKFYAKIRTQLAESEINDATCPPRKNLDETNFGQISDGYRDLILSQYENQQLSSELRDQPVKFKCDDIPDHNCAKLLFSKPAFHNPGSTGYLVDHLNIKDINRDSFLGGHSTYTVREEESLEHCRQRQLGMFIREENKKVNQLLDESKVQEAETLHKTLFSLDPKHPDLMASVGRFQMIAKKYSDSVQSFEAAIHFGCIDPDVVSKHLSEALYNVGFEEFQKRRYGPAGDIFSKALAHNPNNQAALLHKTMCDGQLIRGSLPTYQSNHYSRRK